MAYGAIKASINDPIQARLNICHNFRLDVRVGEFSAITQPEEGNAARMIEARSLFRPVSHPTWSKL